MKMFSRICVYVFLCVSLVYAGGTVDVHAQSRLVEVVFRNYSKTFRHPDVREHFPDVLRAFKKADFQNVLHPVVIHRVVREPRFIRIFYPEVDDSILVLLVIDNEFQALFEDKQFYAVLQDPNEIDELVWLIEATSPPHPCLPPMPLPPRATTLSIVSGNPQSDEVGKPLAQPFVVSVRDQEGKPLGGIQVTFIPTEGADGSRKLKTLPKQTVRRR